MSVALVVRVQSTAGRAALRRALPALRAALPSGADVALAGDTLSVAIEQAGSVDGPLDLIAALTGHEIAAGSVIGDGPVSDQDWLSASGSAVALGDRASTAATDWAEAARAAEGLGDHVTALAWLAAGAQRAPASESLGFLQHKASLLLRQGRHPEAAVAWDEAAELAATLGDLAGEALALSERANVAYRQGQGTQIASLADRALTAAKASGDAQVEARALRYVGIGQEFAGDYASAEATYLELMELQPTGEVLAGVCNSLGEIARATERWQEAIRWYRRFDEEWRNDHGDEQANIIFLNNMGAALVGAGEHARAIKLLKRAAHHQRRQGYLAMLSETYCFLALAALASGSKTEASRHAVEAYLLATDHSEHEMQALALRVLGQLRAAGEEVSVSPDASAEALLRDSIAIFRAAGKTAEVAHSQAALAEILKTSGATDEANALTQQAIATLTELQQHKAAGRIRAQLS